MADSHSTAADWIAGLNVVAAALDNEPEKIEGLWVDRRGRNPRLRSLLEQAAQLDIAVHQVPATELERLVPGVRHQGILARCRTLKTWHESDLDGLLEAAEEPLFLLLDEVQDPHNLGACLRSAAAAGVTAVLIPKDRSAGLTPTVRRSAAGTADRVPLVRVTNLVRAMDRLRQAGVWMVGLAGEGTESLYAVDLKGPMGLVLGGEGRGLRRLTREHCDVLARIPMPGGIESLNVSVATGVSLFEALRQRSA